MYRLGGDNMVRLPLVQGGAGDVLMERKWLPRLAPRLPARIPEVLGAGEPAGVSVAVVGVPVAGGGASQAGALSEPVLLAGDLAAFVTAMRSITLPGAPRAHRGGPVATLDAETGRRSGNCAGSRRRTSTAMLRPSMGAGAAGPGLERAAGVAACRSAAGNLLTDGGRLASVIDFGCMGAGDSACDLFRPGICCRAMREKPSARRWP